MRRELDGFGDGIHHPAKHTFAVRPVRVTLAHLLDRGWVLTGSGIGRGERTEHRINGIKSEAEEADLLALGLSGKEEVVDINVHAG